MIEDALNSLMESRGYKGPNHDPVYLSVLYWYKKIADTTHQIVVKRWPEINRHGPSFEVEITFKTTMNIWSTSKFYGLSLEELSGNLATMESILTDSIEPMYGIKYSYDGED